MRKRLTAVLLALVLALALLPAAALADNKPTSGVWGDPFDKGRGTWNFDQSTGTLTFEGVGEIVGNSGLIHPWYAWREEATSVVFGEGITGIGYAIMQDYKNLETASFPGTLTEIGDYAFANCGLRSLELPSGLQTIGSYAFQFCQDLRSVEIPGNVRTIGGWSFYSCSGLQSVKLPDSLTSMGPLVFERTGLVRVTIPEGVKELPNFAFRDCHSLVEVDLPDTMESIGQSAFAFCPLLTTVKLPASLKTMGASVFDNCGALTEITVPEGVTEMGDGIFAYCPNLKKVTLPSTLLAIPSGAFTNCTSLEQLNIPEGVMIVNDDAFTQYPTGYANKTARVGLPVSLLKIGDDAFSGALTDVYYAGTRADWGNIVISQANSALSGAKIHFLSKLPEKVMTFADVPEGMYCYDPVSWAVGQGITTGTGAGFEPERTCTQGDILTFIYRAMGEEDPGDEVSFTNPHYDETAYYADAMTWAMNQGILNQGYLVENDRDLDPTAPCTRADAVTYLWRLDGSSDTAKSSSFTDVPATVSYGSAVSWAVENGITQGTGDGRFSPDDTCTRAQIVTFLYRYLTLEPETK